MNSNEEIDCGAPSSRTSKSAAVKDETGLPFASTTVASTRTMLVPLRKRPGGVCCSRAMSRTQAPRNTTTATVPGLRGWSMCFLGRIRTSLNGRLRLQPLSPQRRNENDGYQVRHRYDQGNCGCAPLWQSKPDDRDGQRAKRSMQTKEGAAKRPRHEIEVQAVRNSHHQDHRFGEIDECRND